MTMFQSTVNNAECKGTARRSIELVTTIRIKKSLHHNNKMRLQRLKMKKGNLQREQEIIVVDFDQQGKFQMQK
ncbi:hypothetical protein H5410_025806 [Solanum commersonii]|uniref:Uncharacterized protein n=1 Tax=Solanum commersonii TaxID=4109 RepID=A0A9J5YV87_SOLCO|nr:hypothetical protein H5410_025806 [Solanum commersonii]